LILANLIPLFGVLLLGWQVFPILFLFWLENLVIGIFNVIKMLLASPDRLSKNSSKFFVIPFFIIHYGIFTMVHGVIIFVFFGGLQNNDGQIENNGFYSLFNGYSLVWAILALLISHTVSFFINYIGKKEFRSVSVAQLMFQPYGRVIVMHMTILAGAFLLATLGTPVSGLVVLVVLKIILDLYAHLNQHKNRNSRPVTNTIFN
jgi:hypothetical protein